MATRDALIVSVLVFNVLFPTLAYAFTTIVATDSDLSPGFIDADLLLLAGIDVANSTTHTVEWGAGWVEFEQNDATYRTSWETQFDWWTLENVDGFDLQKRTNPIDRAFGTWFFPERIRFANTTNGLAEMGTASNATVVAEYNEEYGWSKIGVEKSSMILLFTHNTTISPTFEDAIMANGTVVITFCTIADDGFSLTGIIDFFAGTLLGDNMYGLPTIFAWIMRLITGLSVLALAWFIKDMTQI
jgi:hypothetical protein